LRYFFIQVLNILLLEAKDLLHAFKLAVAGFLLFNGNVRFRLKERLRGKPGFIIRKPNVTV
jgi:hypothetical protein